MGWTPATACCSAGSCSWARARHLGRRALHRGRVRAAVWLRLSPFYVGIVLSGFEPENLVTGLAAALAGLPQVALGTVVGSTIFLLTGALGLSLLLVPMEVRIPRAGAAAVVASLGAFTAALLPGGRIGRLAGALLLILAVGLLGWLYQRSPAFLPGEEDDEHEGDTPSPLRIVTRLVLGGCWRERGWSCSASAGSWPPSGSPFPQASSGWPRRAGVTTRASSSTLSPIPTTAIPRDVSVLILLGVNFGIIALVVPLAAAPLVLGFHVPYLAGTVLLVAGALGLARRLGRRMGLGLLGFYALYLALNLWHELR